MGLGASGSGGLRSGDGRFGRRGDGRFGRRGSGREQEQSGAAAPAEVATPRPDLAAAASPRLDLAVAVAVNGLARMVGRRGGGPAVGRNGGGGFGDSDNDGDHEEGGCGSF